jgi:hypothetical protein
MKTDDEGEVEALHSARSLRPHGCLLWSSSPPCSARLDFSIPHLPLQSTMPAMKRNSDAMDVTPTGSPSKKMRLTQHQKQALLDNLQLESGLRHTCPG